MRVHISVADDVMTRLQAKVGPRERSSFIEAAIRQALDAADRANSLERAFGAIADEGHDWDTDPAAWVREQRADVRRTG